MNHKSKISFFLSGFVLLGFVSLIQPTFSQVIQTQNPPPILHPSPVSSTPRIPLPVDSVPAPRSTSPLFTETRILITFPGFAARPARDFFATLNQVELRLGSLSRQNHQQLCLVDVTGYAVVGEALHVLSNVTCQSIRRDRVGFTYEELNSFLKREAAITLVNEFSVILEAIGFPPPPGGVSVHN